MKHSIRALLAAAILATGLVVSTTPKAEACAPSPLVQSLQTTRTESFTRIYRHQSRKVIRYYLASNLQQVNSVAISSAFSPQYVEGGYGFYYYAEKWIEQLVSDPCSGPDGFAFGFAAWCYRSTDPPNPTPRTVVACNWDANSALEYDHGSGDWDPVWGYRHYLEQNQGSCTDTGGYHFFSDTAAGKLRTWIRVKVASCPLTTFQRRESQPPSTSPSPPERKQMG